MKQKIKQKIEKRSTELIIVTALLTAIGVGATASSLDILDAGSSNRLVAEYRFDTGAGDTAYDTAGEHNGKIEGATWTDGIKASALKFDGNDDQIPIRMNYDETGVIDQITVCAWVKSSDSSSSQVLASFDRSEYWSLSLSRKDYGNNEGTNVRWDTTDSTDSTADMGTSQSYSDGRWHHICGWFNSSSSTDKKLFIDGELKESRSSHNGNKLGTGMTRYGYIGKTTEAGSFDGGDNENFRLNGKMDNLKIYSNALTSAQIKSLYNSGSWRIGTTTDEDDPSKVVEFSFQHQNSSHVLDTSGYNNHGQKMNGASQEGAINCKVGRCYSFDPSSDSYVEVPYSIDQNNKGKNYTIMAWFNSESIGSEQGIIGQDNGGYDFFVELSRDNNGELMVAVGNDVKIKPGGTIRNDTWYHLAVVMEGDNIYYSLNGESLKDSGASRDNYDESHMNSLAIGDIDSGPHGFTFNGKIDQVKIFNRSLSQQEIIEETQGLEGGGTVLDLRFNRDGGDKVHDHSGENNHGVLQPNSSSGPKWVDGVTGNALNFDGNDDVAGNIPLSGLDRDEMQKSGTISVWINQEEAGDIYNAEPKRPRLIADPGNSQVRWVWFDSTGLPYGEDEVRISGVEPGKWHHIVSKWDNQTGRWEVYRDGKMVKSGDNFDPSTFGWDGRKFCFGEYCDHDTSFYGGKIDQAKIYPYQISKTKIQQLYASGTSRVGGPSSNTISNLQDGLVLSQTFNRIETCGRSDTVSCPSGMSGEVAVDESGEANHGDLVNDPSVKGAGECKVGGCLGFDGKDDYVDAGSEGSLNMSSTDEVAMSAWVKLDKWPENNGIVGRFDYGDGSKRYGYHFYTKNGGEFRFQVANGDHTYNRATGFSTNKWHHLVGTYNGSHARLFVNGNLKDTDAHSAGLGVPSHGFRIGKVDGTFTHMNGTVDQVRVYNRSLSKEKIWKLYSRGRDRETGMAGPVGRWRFDSVSGDTAYDSAGSNDATISGANLTSGKRGTALDFDGVNDEVLGPNSFEPYESDSDPWTMSTWFKIENLPSEVGHDMTILDNNARYHMQMNTGDNQMRSIPGGNSFTWDWYPTKEEWHHATLVYDGSGTAKAYGDGELKKTIDGISPYESDLDGGEFAMGSHTGNRYFDGKIDGVNVYPYALSQEQVKQVMSSGAVSIG